MNDVVQLLVFCLRERRYALRLPQVEYVLRAVDYAPLPQSPDIVLGVIDLHGEIVPLLCIRERLGMGQREVGVDDQFIVARTSARKVALVVDTVIGMIERPATVIVPAAGIVPCLPLVDGVMQMEDGLVIIHDLDRFLSLEEEQALAHALTGRPRHGS